jgi:hypothetical protein
MVSINPVLSYITPKPIYEIVHILNLFVPILIYNSAAWWNTNHILLYTVYLLFIVAHVGVTCCKYV